MSLNNNKKIAMFVEAWKPKWGGAQEVAFQISNELSKLNYKIDLFVMNLDGFKEIEIINNNFRVIRIGKKKKWSLLNRIKWFFALNNEFKKYQMKNNYNFLYAHANLPGFYIKYFSFKYGLKTILHIHGLMSLRMKISKLFKFIEYIIYLKLKYSLEISCSRDIFEFESKNINKNVVFLENGTTNFRDFKKEITFIKKLLFIGRLDYQKGVDILIKSVYNLREEFRKNNIYLDLFGYGPNEQEYRNLVFKLNLEDIINFKGGIFGKDKQMAFRESDLFLLPSRDEGFPLVLFEAISNKIPILCSNVGENSYIIKNKKTGFIFDYTQNDEENIRILTNKLMKVIKYDINKYNVIKENAFNLVKNDFTWNKIVLKLDKYLNGLK